jgi:sugar lactone lactonase YvrE
MALETFEAGYAGANPPRSGTQWQGVWRLMQQVDRIIDESWPQPWSLAGTRTKNGFFSTGTELTPTGIFFKPDGTKFYLTGQALDLVQEYTCVKPWDINTAFLTGSFSIAAQTSTVTALFFKDDGTKFYVTGGTSVHEYTLSTSWNINTAVFNLSFSNSGQDSSVFGFYFKPDGTKFYLAGAGNDRIYQYSCATAWNLGTASYDNVSFSVAAQDGTPTGVWFKPDGTKFYLTGQINDSIYEYDCSTPWDISTASYTVGNFLNVGNIVGGSPRQIYFKDDGTTFYCLDSTRTNLVELYCRTPWQINTGYTYIFSTGSQDSLGNDIFFRSDGTTFYLIGATSDTVYQYTCSTAWDLSTAAYTSKSFSVTTQETTPAGLFFKDDGTRFYVVGSTNDTVYQYSCSTAWDVSTASYDSKSFSVTTQESAPNGLCFKNDGTKFYIIGTGSDAVYQYSCSTAWDISTAFYDFKSFSVFNQENAPLGITFKTDGTEFYIVGQTNDTVYQYRCLTAWDISTAYYTGVSFNMSALDNDPRGLFFNPDGQTVYLFGTQKDLIYQCPLLLE